VIYRRFAIFGTVILAGCMTAQGPKMVWARKDGQRMMASPALAAQGKSDLIQCNAQAAQAAGAVNMPADVSVGGYGYSGFGTYRQVAVQGGVLSTTQAACMDARGYELIPLPKGETYIPT
jgi:hypothetical protein